MSEVAGTVEGLLEQKLAYLREIQMLTQQEVLLVNLDDLTELLERKDALIARIGLVDAGLEEAMQGRKGLSAMAEGLLEEIDEVIEAALENERTLEERIGQEQAQLRRELQAIDREARVARYLEGQQRKGRRIDLKR